MSDFSCSCGCRWSCTAVAVVISVILGVIAAFLQFAGVIAVTPMLLGVAFAVAVGYLAVLLVAAAIALYLVSEGLPFENVWVLLAIRTFLLMVFVSYIVKNDFPLRSLPVIGKYFR